MIDIAEILYTGREELRKFVVEYLMEHVYLKSGTLAKYLLDKLHNIALEHMEYNKCKLNWTFKIAKILKEMTEAGILEIYRKGNSTTLYKVKKKNE